MIDVAASNDIYSLKKRVDKLEKIVDILINVKDKISEYRKQVRDAEIALSNVWDPLS